MIPKIIHYCWLSNDPVPNEMLRYMESWHKVLPDYEFVKWDFNRFDKQSSAWVSEAFDNKKYAFAADYIRLYALYHYGGIYMDMDVEVLRSFNPLLHLNAMMCYETVEYPQIGKAIEAATIGAERQSQWVKQCLDYYNNRHFVKDDGSMDERILPFIVKECIEQSYTLRPISSIVEAETIAENELPVFPSSYFSPKNYRTLEEKVQPETYSIHHYSGSWEHNRTLHRVRMILVKYLHMNYHFVDAYLPLAFKGKFGFVFTKLFILRLLGVNSREELKQKFRMRKQ